MSSNVQLSQTPWLRPNVQGHSWENGRIDHTEAFGAFDSICRSYSLGRTSIDIGGGEYDFNSAYLFQRYDIRQVVVDPFKRTSECNNKILQLAKNKPFDSCTSISVLNVIDLKKARLDHIGLCRSVVKETGKVFFKVWPGNGTGIPETRVDSFQSNRDIETYIDEIRSVFGKSHVKLDQLNKIIIAVKINP